MQHKKIALFISHIYGDYQKNLSQGVIDKALEYGFQTEVYATNEGENLGNFSATEDCILSLPAYKNLDGIIFASGTYANSELREDLRKKLSTLNDIPVIEVADADYSFPYISLDNNVTAGATSPWTYARTKLTAPGRDRAAADADVAAGALVAAADARSV